MNKELKKKHLIELKGLEAHYNRNLNQLQLLQELQTHISSRMQILINKLLKDE